MIIFNIEKIIEWLRKIPVKRIWKWLDNIKISLALIVVVALLGGGVAAILLLTLSLPLTQLNGTIDLTSFCGGPATGNLTPTPECQWPISDFNAVCQWQYPPTQYPNLARPLHLTFGDPTNPDSGQCYDRNNQPVSNPHGGSGVNLDGYCNNKLPDRPTDVNYEAQPAAKTDQWTCVRPLDILAACITTFQESDLVALVQNGNLICYRHG